jgi:hypothetical protein
VAVSSTSATTPKARVAYQRAIVRSRRRTPAVLRTWAPAAGAALSAACDAWRDAASRRWTSPLNAERPRLKVQQTKAQPMEKA